MKKILGVLLSLSLISGQIGALAADASISSVTASSYYSAWLGIVSYPASNAIDGKANTYWQSADNNENYLQLDLGSAQYVTKVSLSAKADSTNEERTDFELWLSNDSNFSNYVRVPCIVTTASYPDRLKVGKIYDVNTTYTKEIDLPDAYRYVRYVKLTGAATISEIAVETGSASTDNNVENTNPEDFEVNSCFKDSAGDKTDRFVKNSSMSFFGEIKNNTSKTTDLYCIAAVYDEEGRLQSAVLDEKSVGAGESVEFSADSLEIGADGARVCGFVFDKETMNPVCETQNTEEYVQGTYDIFVSQENGDDTNGDGTVLKPYATLATAETKAQTFKSSKNEANVYIKNGEYYMTSTLDISGNGYSAAKPITYTGFGTDETLVSGGTKVTSFTPEGNGIYSASVDLSYVSDIYVNDERRGVASSELLVPQSEAYDTTNSIYGPVVDEDFLGDNITYTDGMEIFYPAIKWRSYTYKLQNITNSDGAYTLAIVPNAAVQNRETYEAKDLPTDFDKSGFYLRNSKQFLDEEGEWYFDKTEKKLYYIPYSDEDINECEIYASGAVDTIIRIANGAKYRNFEGLTFAHTGWEKADSNGELRWLGHDMILPTGYTYGSGIHGIPVPGALQTSYSTSINVRNCVFKHTGGVGIAFQSKMTSCDIVGNVFYDIADSAMYLGHYNYDYDKDPSTDQSPNNVNIKNNVITGTGKKYSSPALTVYGTKNVTVSHNDISDCPYSGIFIGAAIWNNTLGGDDVTEEHDADSYASNNNVSYNSIHEVAKKNVDGAGIYTVSHNHGSVISNNYVKNQYMDYSALYNDDGSACYTMFNNVLESVPGWIYHWNNEIVFINAYDNYSTTDENYTGLLSIKSDIEDVNIFQSQDKPTAVQEIIANAGLESEYKEKIGKYIPNEPQGENVAFTTQPSVTASVGELVLLNAGFEANDSGRYRWKAIGSNKSNVSFKSYLTSYWKKGMQFEKIYATFSAAGTYEVVCEADDGRGNIYANKMTVTVT